MGQTYKKLINIQNIIRRKNLEDVKHQVRRRNMQIRLMQQKQRLKY